MSSIEGVIKFSMDCPLCRVQQPPKGPFRFRIIGRFTGKPEQELGSAMRIVGAKEMVEAFQKWPAVEPDSLRILDTIPELDSK